MASDGFRYLLASAPTILAGGAVGFIVHLVRPESVGTAEFVVWIYFGGCTLFSLIYAGLTWAVFGAASDVELRDWLTESPSGRERRQRTELLAGSGGTTGAVSFCSLAIAAVISTAVRPDLSGSPVVLTLAALVVAASWLLIAVAYALHYAREDANLGGLIFPTAEAEGGFTFSDYSYLAIQVSTSFSSADVTVVGRDMRRVVTAHATVAFVFNTVLIALLVSLLITAG